MIVEWPAATWFVIATLVAIGGIWLIATLVVAVIESRRDAEAWRKEEDRIRRRFPGDGDDDHA